MANIMHMHLFDAVSVCWPYMTSSESIATLLMGRCQSSLMLLKKGGENGAQVRDRQRSSVTGNSLELHRVSKTLLIVTFEAVSEAEWRHEGHQPKRWKPYFFVRTVYKVVFKGAWGFPWNSQLASFVGWHCFALLPSGPLSRPR